MFGRTERHRIRAGVAVVVIVVVCVAVVVCRAEGTNRIEHGLFYRSTSRLVQMAYMRRRETWKGLFVFPIAWLATRRSGGGRFGVHLVVA